MHSSGVLHRFAEGRCAVLVDGRVVAAGTGAAMTAAARLLDVGGKVGCMSPNGRTDVHGDFVEWNSEQKRGACAFCGEPV
jgi:hypothetical protein